MPRRSGKEDLAAYTSGGAMRLLCVVLTKDVVYAACIKTCCISAELCLISTSLFRNAVAVNNVKIVESSCQYAMRMDSAYIEYVHKPPPWTIENIHDIETDNSCDTPYSIFM